MRLDQAVVHIAAAEVLVFGITSPFKNIDVLPIPHP